MAGRWKHRKISPELRSISGRPPEELRENSAQSPAGRRKKGEPRSIAKPPEEA
ncbi:hypothetical protein KSP40_PGU013619 [Platanthera guangdongensis]|uniref:Uncharacterized protein n=1 Tax=Platanthera guangdongensis TaxID=2320717 RepID=A0ABR2LSZ5_9ASPA